MRRFSIAIMFVVWMFTSTILLWGLTGKIDFFTLVVLYVVPYLIWMLIEFGRRKLGS